MTPKSSGGGSKIEIPMAPMIDIVFQLLIFFMLTLRISTPEGNFNINMPLAGPGKPDPTTAQLPNIEVKLISDANGNLTQLMLGGRSLGNDMAAFGRLNSEILRMIGNPNNPLTKDLEVTIDADYELQYQYVIKAVSAVTGRFDPATKQVVRYVEKIKFAPQHKPKA